MQLEVWFAVFNFNMGLFFLSEVNVDIKVINMNRNRNESD